MVSCNISVYTILFMTPIRLYCLLCTILWLPSKKNCNGPNVFLFLHMWIRFLEQLRSLKTNNKRMNVQSILYAKSFVCNQHLNSYRPTVRHQFLIPPSLKQASNNNNNKEQPKNERHHDLPWPLAPSSFNIKGWYDRPTLQDGEQSPHHNNAMFLHETYSFSILFTFILHAADGRAHFEKVSFVVDYRVLVLAVASNRCAQTPHVLIMFFRDFGRGGGGALWLSCLREEHGMVASSLSA